MTNKGDLRCVEVLQDIRRKAEKVGELSGEGTDDETAVAESGKSADAKEDDGVAPNGSIERCCGPENSTHIRHARYVPCREVAIELLHAHEYGTNIGDV